MSNITGLSDKTQAVIVFVMMCLIILGSQTLPPDTPAWVKYLIGFGAALGMAMKEIYGSKPK